MSILSKITGESFESIEKRYTGLGYGVFKKEVAEVVGNLLETIQTRYKKYDNKEILDKILQEGAKKAQVAASRTLNNAMVNLGLK